MREAKVDYKGLKAGMPKRTDELNLRGMRKCMRGRSVVGLDCGSGGNSRQTTTVKGAGQKSVKWGPKESSKDAVVKSVRVRIRGR